MCFKNCILKLDCILFVKDCNKKFIFMVILITIYVCEAWNLSLNFDNSFMLIDRVGNLFAHSLSIMTISNIVGVLIEEFT
jgi:hypothetical protein